MNLIKKESVTNRNLENYPESFMMNQKLGIIVLLVTPGSNLVVDTCPSGESLEFTVIPM